MHDTKNEIKTSSYFLIQGQFLKSEIGRVAYMAENLRDARNASRSPPEKEKKKTWLVILPAAPTWGPLFMISSFLIVCCKWN